MLPEDKEKSLKKLTQTIASLPKPNPYLLLERAELFLAANNWEKASNDLKNALFLYPSYSFYPVGAEILNKLIKTGQLNAKRRIKIALLSNASSELLASVLQTICFRDGILADIYTGDCRREILNEGSKLYHFKPDIAVIFLTHHYLNLDADNYLEKIDAASEDVKKLWQCLKNQHSCHIIQAGFDYPPDGAWGMLEDNIPGGRNRVITRINLDLSENLPVGISFIDTGKIQRHLGQWFFSNKEWHHAGQYPSTIALPVFAEYICAQLRAILGLSAKVLAVDLDNTLWGGIIGEDGIEKIKLGGSAEGEAYLQLQKYIKDLDEKGILLTVCSKNNLRDAKLPFENHPSMILKFEDFIIFTANWEDKATNLKNMARKLSLSLDSFVFLDDNPRERAWVREALPEVIVPECSDDPWEMLSALRRGMYFESIKLTTEDRARYEDYKQNLTRRHFEKMARVQNISQREFLQSLNMSVHCGNVDEQTLARVTQLINKSNQFNLTTRRYSEIQIKKMSELGQSCLVRWYRLKDRFGEQGIVGVIIVRKKGSIWHIDTWLMSCRVLGRQVERFMFKDLIALAKASGVLTLLGEYIPTAKNSMVEDLYPNLGFTYDENSDYYTFAVSSNAEPECDLISYFPE